MINITELLDGIKFNWDKGENWNKAEVKKALEKVSHFVYAPQDKFNRGIPDIIYMDTDGRLCAIELKLEGKKWTSNTPLQKHVLHQISYDSTGQILIITKTNSYSLEKI